jgi:hypothetical protein
MIGCWLLMSPFIFRHSEGDWQFWATDFGCGFAVIVLALASYWSPLRHAHLMILVVAGWLVGFGRLHQGPPLPPALQNDILVGLTLALLALIPSQASEPPRTWQQWYSQKVLGGKSQTGLDAPSNTKSAI